MRRSAKIALGIVTLFHFCLAFILIPGYLGYDVLRYLFTKISVAPKMEAFIGILIACVLNAFFLGFPLLYILDAAHNKALSKVKQPFWIFFLLFFGLIAMPIYWYLHIWKEPKSVG